MGIRHLSDWTTHSAQTAFPTRRGSEATSVAPVTDLRASAPRTPNPGPSHRPFLLLANPLQPPSPPMQSGGCYEGDLRPSTPPASSSTTHLDVRTRADARALATLPLSSPNPYNNFEFVMRPCASNLAHNAHDRAGPPPNCVAAFTLFVMTKSPRNGASRFGNTPLHSGDGGQETTPLVAGASASVRSQIVELTDGPFRRRWS